MKKGLNFRTIESQKEYFEAYEKALKLIAMPVVEKYVTTSFGDSHVVCCGDENNPPLVLLSPVQTFAKMYPSFFFKIMKMGFHPTRENVENYIGWGSEREEPLSDSIIKLFTISVMNMNSNASFPKWLKRKQLWNIKMPVLMLLGENEFAFSTKKAVKRARTVCGNLELHIVEGASHLLCASEPDYINNKVLEFLTK